MNRSHQYEIRQVWRDYIESGDHNERNKLQEYLSFLTRHADSAAYLRRYIESDAGQEWLALNETPNTSWECP